MFGKRKKTEKKTKREEKTTEKRKREEKIKEEGREKKELDIVLEVGRKLGMDIGVSSGGQAPENQVVVWVVKI